MTNYFVKDGDYKISFDRLQCINDRCCHNKKDQSSVVKLPCFNFENINLIQILQEVLHGVIEMEKCGIVATTGCLYSKMRIYFNLKWSKTEDKYYMRFCWLRKRNLIGKIDEILEMDLINENRDFNGIFWIKIEHTRPICLKRQAAAAIARQLMQNNNCYEENRDLTLLLSNFHISEICKIFIQEEYQILVNTLFYRGVRIYGRKEYTGRIWDVIK